MFSISEHYYGIEQIEDGLEFRIGNWTDTGWCLDDCKNIIVALTIINGSKYIEEVVKILTDNIPYDSEMIKKSIDDGGDLNWIYWLSGGNSMWHFGRDTDIMYNYFDESLYSGDISSEEELDKISDKCYEEYDADLMQEQLRDEYISQLISCIESSDDWSTLVEELGYLKDEIHSEAYSKLQDFASGFVPPENEVV